MESLAFIISHVKAGTHDAFTKITKARVAKVNNTSIVE